MKMEVTFTRAIKVWWSFAWRVWILSLPMMALIAPLMFWLLPTHKLGEPPSMLPPDQVPFFFVKFSLVWIVMAVGTIGVHVAAVRWGLKVKWSDFRLVAVSTEET